VGRGVADLIAGTDLAAAFANAILKVADVPVRAEFHVAKAAHAGPEVRIADLIGTAHDQVGPTIGERLRAALAETVDRVARLWSDAGHPASADD
jgi:predicted nuclease with TOPRIM domain